MRISLIQMKVLSTPMDNLEKIKQLVCKAKAERADIAVLPEMCCCAYENSAFEKYAMPEDDEFIKGLAECSRENAIIIVAGSVPEKTAEGIYNTSFVFGKQGDVIARHRKVHLFDIDVTDGQYFKESDTFSAGDAVTVFDTEWGKVGLMICFDVRFPELARRIVDKANGDVKLIIVPAAFNATTGPQHWELLFRARALDNQVYMAGCASATDLQQSYHSWGHSIVTNPWGDVVAQLGTDEDILTLNLDFQYVDRIRNELPVLRNRRRDLY